MNVNDNEDGASDAAPLNCILRRITSAGNVSRDANIPIMSRLSKNNSYNVQRDEYQSTCCRQ